MEKARIMKRVIITIIMAAGISLLITELLPNNKQVVRMYRSMRSSGRRTRKDILDIYND